MSEPGETVVEQKLVLRIKSKQSQSAVMRDVNRSQTIRVFLQRLSSMTGVPEAQIALLRGFPPKRVAFDQDATLDTLGLLNQDTLIVEQDTTGLPQGAVSSNSGSQKSVPFISGSEDASLVVKVEQEVNDLSKPDPKKDSFRTKEQEMPPLWALRGGSSDGQPSASSSLPTVPPVKNQLIINALNSSTMRDLDSQPERDTTFFKPNISNAATNYVAASYQDDPNVVPPGMMLRQVVPSDNSCLFTSIMFCMSGTMTEHEDDSSAQHLRELIAATVVSDPDEYNDAMLGRSNHEYVEWILKKDSWGGGIELAILSSFYAIEISVVDIQSLHISNFGEDKQFPTRIVLLYDGIHYDPLFLEPFDGGKLRTIFPTSDTSILEKAQQLGQEAKAAHQFTDLRNFSLKCTICNSLLRGQTEAQLHAKQTGHAAFAETT